MEISDLRRLRQLEDENSRLKRLVADVTMDNQALKELIQNGHPQLGGRRCGGRTYAKRGRWAVREEVR